MSIRPMNLHGFHHLAAALIVLAIATPHTSAQSTAGGPPNDFCQSATVIPGNVVNYNPANLITTGAGNEICQNDESCEPGNIGTSNSVWYSYTPVADGSIEISTLGSNYDTVLSVWDRCGGFPLCTFGNEFACVDDYFFGVQSLLNMDVSANTEYLIKVADDNPNAGGGSLDFSLRYRPPNNLCTRPMTVVGTIFNPPLISTHNAQTENCEAAESCEVNNVGTSNAVWYSFIPPCDGTIDVDTEGSTYDTVLSIFDGCGAFIDPDAPCDQPNELACDDDAGTGTLSQILGFVVEEGVEYLIKAADYNTAIGGGYLDFNVRFHGADPPIAEITQPTGFQCLCDSIDIIGTARDAANGPVEYTLDYQPTSGGPWTLIANSQLPIINDTLAVWNTSQLSQGYYLLRLTVETGCGQSESAVVVTFVDKQFDTLELNLPPQNYIGAGSICIDGSVWDNCFDHYTVSYRQPNTAAGQPVDPANPTYTTTVINNPLASWATNPGGPPDGDYELVLRAEDDCQHTATIIRDVTIDNTSPTALITSPVNCASLEHGIIPIEGTVDDANLNAWVVQYTGGNANGWVTIDQGTGSIVNDILTQWDTTNLQSCAYTIRVVATDQSIRNCDDPLQTVFLVSVMVGDGNGDPCPVDLNNDGQQDLLDFGVFQDCADGEQ